MYTDPVTGDKWTVCGSEPCNACKDEYFAHLEKKGLMKWYKELAHEKKAADMKAAEEAKWKKYREEGVQATVTASALVVNLKGGKDKPEPPLF